MWARINNGAVAEITDIDPAGRFHPSIQWVEFDGRKGVKVGWTYDGSEFSEPEPEPEPVRNYFTYKTDIWQRVTDAEAETLDAQLGQAPAKQRRMWDDAQSVEHSSDYYFVLREQMISEFGESRTDEVLAPSN